MDTAWHIKARITPWDDPGFVRAFEQARQAVEDEGLPYGYRGPAVERRVRELGYPFCTIRVDRTVQEALEQTSHWTVSRDG